MRILLACILSVALISGVTPSLAAEETLLTWEDCVRLAAQNHPDLVAASAAVAQSEAAKRSAASGAYPQVDASAGFSTSKTEGEEGRDSYSARVNGSQLLYDGAQTANSVKAAQENIQAARQSYRFTSAEVRQRLRNSFVGLLKAQEMTRIAREIFEIRRQNLELITLRYQSGLEHKGALLTAEASLAQAQYAIISSERDLEVARRGLAKELGTAERAGPLAVKGDFAVKEDPAGEDLVLLADSHPKVQRLVNQKNAAEFDLKATYGKYLPAVSVDGNIQEAGERLSSRTAQAQAGVTVTLPLFEGGLRRAQVQQGRAQVTELAASLRSTRDGVVLALEQARAALLDAMDNVDVQRKVLIAAQERSRIAQTQYSIGTISFDSWTIIEDNLVNAKRTYLNAQADALIAEAEWKQAKGETLE